MKPRVVHIIGGGDFGGAEDHIIHLLQQLKHEEFACEVICFYDSLFAKMLREQQIPVEVLSYGRFDIRLLFGLSALLKRKNPDIVHTHGVKANFFARFAVKKGGRPLLITTVHSLLKYDYTHPLAYRLALLLENSTRAKNNYFIAISNKIKKQLLTEKVNKAAIQVIHHGIDTEKFAPRNDRKAEQLAKQWGKADGVFLIGAVGRIQAVKGFRYFIEACAELHSQKPGAYRFVLVGDGPKRAELEKLVAETNLAEVFHFAGFRNDVDSCLRAFDGYVSSSLSEGLGLAVMEALATGTAVVTTGVGGINDFARHEENCLVIEPEKSDQIAAALTRLSEDQLLASTLSAQAVEDIRNDFSLAKMAKETAYYYQQWLK